MPDLEWAFENHAVRDAGALPPEPLDLAYATRTGPPARDVQRAAAMGRPVTPADCGPVRVIANYGYTVRCPGTVTLTRAVTPARDRQHHGTTATFGHAVIGGDLWPVGDSGRIASWISGSEYVKIQTGVMIFFPRGTYLYQGPLPNSRLIAGLDLDVMAGLEYPTRKQTWPVGDAEGRPWASINVIARLPPPGRTVTLAPGDPLCWVFAVPARSSLTLTKYGHRTGDPR
jgi:hypothetical protein